MIRRAAVALLAAMVFGFAVGAALALGCDPASGSPEGAGSKEYVMWVARIVEAFLSDG